MTQIIARWTFFGTEMEPAFKRQRGIAELRNTIFTILKNRKAAFGFSHLYQSTRNGKFLMLVLLTQNEKNRESLIGVKVLLKRKMESLNVTNFFQVISRN